MSFLFADSISKLSYGYLRKSGHTHYNMFFFQQNPPLAFGRTMLWKWLKRSCLQCTLQAANVSLSFSLLLLKVMPITWKALRNYCPDHRNLITVANFSAFGS